jgi:ribosomal protein S18 acetylase RimI-like enzyme
LFIYKIKQDITDLELKEVAKLHLGCLKTGFLSSLGEGFLFLLYKTIAFNASGILIIAKDGQKVVGFVSGTVNLKQIYKVFIRKYFWLLPVILIKKLTSWQTLNKIKDLIFYPLKQSHSQKNTKHNQAVPQAELLSIAVLENYRGQQIAVELYQHLVAQFKLLAVAEFKIIVGGNLLQAQRFYDKMGAKKQRQLELHKGESSWLYLASTN